MIHRGIGCRGGIKHVSVLIYLLWKLTHNCMSYEMFITAKQCYRDFGAAKPNKTIFWYFQIIGGIATKLFLYTYLIYSKISIYRCVKSSYMVVCVMYIIKLSMLSFSATSRREKNRENVSLASSRCPTSLMPGLDCWLLEVFLQNAFGFFWLLKDGREAEFWSGISSTFFLPFHRSCCLLAIPD